MRCVWVSRSVSGSLDGFLDSLFVGDDRTSGIEIGTIKNADGFQGETDFNGDVPVRGRNKSG